MSTPGKPMYAFARVDKLKTFADLVDAQLHADRDPSARFEIRAGTDPVKDQIRWTRGAGDGVFNLVEGWRQAKGSARERARAPICMHLILGVSASWVQIAGGLHERDNPRNRALLNAAKDFVEGQIGPVAAVRLDLDEMGGAVVDVFAVPVYERQRRLCKDGSRSDDGVLEISCNKAFEGLRSSTKERGDYSALQTGWANYAQTHLDKALVRGQRKYMTDRRHLETPEYRAQQQALDVLKKEAEAAQVVLDELTVEKKAIDDAKRSLEWREAGIDRLEREYRSEIDREVKTLAAAWTRLADGEELTDADRASMSAPMAIKASAALEAAIAAVEAEKATQDKRAADNLREEERVAGLRFDVKERAHELDKREEKVGNDEQAIRTRDAGSRARAAELEKKESRLRVAEQEAQAATERASRLVEEAQTLVNRIMAAVHGVIRQWRPGSKEGDAELLLRADVASLKEPVNLVLEEIDQRRRGLEQMEQTVAIEIEKMHALSAERSKQWAALQDLKTDLDKKDKEITQKASELEAKDARLTERETMLNDAVVKHDGRVAADKERVRRFGPALRRHLIGAPLAEDQAILDDPMFDGIRVQVDATRKALVVDIAAKRETRDKLANESTVLDRQSAKIKAIGPALAAWLAGERSDELKAKLGQPEAKPFVDAINGLLHELAERRKNEIAETDLEIKARIEEARKEEEKAADRLAETEKRASDLANSIEANEEKAREIKKKLNRYGQFIDKLADHERHMPTSSQIEQTIADADRQAQTAQQLRKPQVKRGFERD
ncbi:hypothetical protein [Rhabdaerophilum sp. SD176]|uniref:hypothetical protein n=1 Tax=Rhabdaerophilum sp. SD176 TaxID=2983548 RepID=UPI0024E00982|nr:hypothetical protein [Rhabdaerophilum sp. SD176]